MGFGSHTCSSLPLKCAELDPVPVRTVKLESRKDPSLDLYKPDQGKKSVLWKFEECLVLPLLGVDPGCGVLDPKEAVIMAVSCDAFAFGQEDSNNDRINIEWTDTPDGAAKQFRREWFQADGMVRRKNLPIQFNR